MLDQVSSQLSESAIRSVARRVGLRVQKWSGHPLDARAGTFMVLDAETGAVVAAVWPMLYGLSLSEVRDFVVDWSSRRA